MSTQVREEIEFPDSRSIADLDPTVGVSGIAGIRVFDVGQGDSISVLSETGQPFMQIDYGGNAGHPFSHPGRSDVGDRMPLDGISLLMLTHWDTDHWCSAEDNAAAANLRWLVPRQTTSPRAAVYSTKLKSAWCIPESKVGQPVTYETTSGDVVTFEKISRKPRPGSTSENCNLTGVAFSVLKKRGSSFEVILLPGDAPFNRVAHYEEFRKKGFKLRAMIAFHHGSKKHWTRATRAFVAGWSTLPLVDVIFSYAEGNSYGHPTPTNYCGVATRWSSLHTPSVRPAGKLGWDVLFE